MSYINHCSIKLPIRSITDDFIQGLANAVNEDAQGITPTPVDNTYVEVFIAYCSYLEELIEYLQDYSKSLADVLISVESYGESFGDYNMYYFMNGKVQEESAIFPDFDPTKLVNREV